MDCLVGDWETGPVGGKLHHKHYTFCILSSVTILPIQKFKTRAI